MKRKSKVLIFVFVVLILVAGFAGKAFVIGEPVSGEQLKFSTFIKDNKLELKVKVSDSGVALRGWKVERKGDTVYISARKVMVSPMFDDGSYETDIDVKGVNKVVLGGRTIWPINE